MAFRIFPIEIPIWDEEWTNLASTPNALRRFVFVPHGRGLDFYVTFVLAGSDKRAHAICQRSQMVIQMPAKMSKEFGADELLAWPSHLTGRWGHTVAIVSTDGASLRF